MSSQKETSSVPTGTATPSKERIASASRRASATPRVYAHEHRVGAVVALDDLCAIRVSACRRPAASKTPVRNTRSTPVAL
jgi:hypothetical protein